MCVPQGGLLCGWVDLRFRRMSAGLQNPHWKPSTLEKYTVGLIASLSHHRCKYSHFPRDHGDCGHHLQGALWRVGGCSSTQRCPLAVTPADFREAWWALLADFYPKSKRHTGQDLLNHHLLVQGLLLSLTSLHLLEACSSVRTSVVWADSLALSEAGH